MKLLIVTVTIYGKYPRALLEGHSWADQQLVSSPDSYVSNQSICIVHGQSVILERYSDSELWTCSKNTEKW